MPFLHYETDERRAKMADAIKHAQNQDKSTTAQIHTSYSPTADDALIEAYLCASPPLHVRRTLDQFFYHGIDTTDRDRDQVVYRYCKKRHLEPRVFMVDQCWLWILGNGMLYKLFEHRYLFLMYADFDHRIGCYFVPPEMAAAKERSGQCARWNHRRYERKDAPTYKISLRSSMRFKEIQDRRT